MSAEKQQNLLHVLANYEARGEAAKSFAPAAVTVAELQCGVAKSARPEQNGLALGAFLAPLLVLPFDEPAASTYGTVRAALERAGTPIGRMDLVIGAHALAAERTLVTNNPREFRRIAGLNVENWARA